MRKRIVLVDDHKSVRQMLADIMSRDWLCDVVGQAGSGTDALKVCADTKPDVLVLDLVLPQFSGVEVMRRLQVMLPEMRTVIFTGAVNDLLIREALRCRPHGFVEKTGRLESLREAIAAVISGRRYYSASAKLFLQTLRETGGASLELTARERKVLKLIADGYSNRRVAERLRIAVRTAEHHRSHLMKKLNLHDVADLARYAVRNGFVSSGIRPEVNSDPCK